MRYEDASGTDFSANEAAQSSTLSAHNDADVILAGKFGPATGNAITGAGTVSGSAGADSIASGHASITAIQGAGGTDTTFSGGHLQIAGQYGVLTMDAQGDYSYVRNHGTPNGVSDVFNYTLSASDGATDVATLTINIGKTPTVIQANAVQVVPGPNGVVTLPAGVELSDIHVVGRNLVIDMPDGSQMVIVDGAVFVPQLVLGTVEVPSTNLAALLIDSEPQPAAGPPQSSGGNFEVPVGPLDPGVPLGDLIPPTELHFTPPDVEEIGQFIREDEAPLAGLASVQLDDDAQPGGNAGGPNDDPGGSTASGILPGSGGDGALTWDLLNSGAPAGFSYIDGPNGSILVQQVQDGNTVTVLTITIDVTDGDFTVTQLAAIRHTPGGNDENNAIFNVGYTVTDSDGDIAAGTLTINVDDDTPTVTVTAGSDAEVSLTTHDAATIGAASEAVSTSANFGGVFSGSSVSPGADGAGSGTTSGYALSTTGGASSLTQGGVAINLYNVGGVIIGSTAVTSGGINAANTVFSVGVSGTGVVTLTQFSQIDHTNADPTPGGAPFTDHSISLADGSITLTRSETVIDKDGDSVTGSASVGIGANLHFVDDGPTIGLADRGEPSLTVDETNLAANATASFAANFGASFGADGPAASGSITYALGISSPGVSSGLVDVATGSSIVLVLNGAVVEGHVGNAAGALAFTVSVNAAGDVTLDQIRALSHPNSADPNDSVTLSADSLITLTATAHDFDGDTASAALNIGRNLNFLDDGPSISASTTQPTLTVDETSLATNATASFASVFTSAFGADGAGTVTYALGISAPSANSGLIDVATGSAIVLVLNGAVVEGHVGNAAGALAFTVSVNAAGDVTLDQMRALSHPDANNPNDSVTLSADTLVTLTATVTDKDGDHTSAVANIGTNLAFLDDGPSISASSEQPTLTVDETNLATNASASFASVFTSAFGADGAGTVTYALGISAPSANSGLIDVATGSAIVLVLNGNVVEGHVATAGGALAFTVSVNAAGDVTLDQIRAVQHPDANNPNDSVTLSADTLVTLTATVTDKDGDHASAVANIGQNLNFLDDGPSISASSEQPTLTVDETVLATNATASFAGVFTSAFGADGAGTVTYALGISAPGANSGLIDVATGSAIVLVLNGAVVEGHVGNAAGALAFTVSVNAAGDVTLDQIRALQHPDANNANDSVTLSADTLVTLTATITDKDGDHQSATANIGTNLAFLDDGPSINANGAQPTLTVDETVLLTNATASFAGVFNSAFGADGAGTVTYALGISAPGANSGLIDVATGQAIVLVQNGAVVEGHVGNAAGALAFTASVNAAGDVTLDQIRALQHPNAANPNDSVTLSADTLVTLTATVTDKDGDHTSATANIGQNLVFLDDGPSAINDADTVASGATTATGNVITGIGTDGGAATADNAGADQPGHITAIQGADGTDTTFAAGVLSIGGAFGTLDIDANGNYTYTRDPGSPGSVQDVFTYTLTDADGDSTTATLTINITDNPVNQPDLVTVLLDDDALLNGNPGGPGDRAPDTQNTSGNLIATGGDGDLDYFLSASQTLPTGFTSSLSSLAGVQTLQISQNGTLVITVTLTNETGAYTVVQNAPIMHALDGNTEGEIPVGNILSAINVSFFAKDADGSLSPTQNISISVDDDTPTVTASPTQPTLTVDETNLATNATASFAGVFTDSFGADGPAVAGSVAYALGISAPGANSGLIDVATGSAVVLVLNGAVVEGHVGNAAGALAFTVSVNAAGDVTLDQIRALQHPDANNANDSVSPTADNLITLTQTITDKDGDSASATANIGQNLVFQDDGPSISASTTQPNLTVDETVLATNATASFAAVFTSAFGADGAGTVTYALGISAPSANSGLIDVATGSAIVLVNNAGVIEGHVATAGGALAFTVSVNAAGDVTLDQIRAVQHPDANNANDSVTLSADTLVTLTATVTDKDGDHQSATANIGQNLTFLDDGPSIGLSGSENSLTVDETNLATNATAAFATAFTSAFGADGAGTVTYALTVTGGNGVASGLIDVATGSAIVLVNNAGVIEGHVATTGGALAFTVSVNAAGDVTLDQIRAVQHPDANNANDSVSLTADNLVVLTATVTDKDGDHASAALNIGQNLNFLDDGPSISASTTQPNLTVDETNLATNASASFASVFTSAFGADGAGTVTYALGISAPSANSGLIDVATGSAIVLVLNGAVVEGHVATAGGALAFTVSVNAAGDVTLDQIRAVQHPDANNANDSVTLSADTLVTLTATVTDKDGDHQAATANIGQNLNFLDDGPSISASTTQPTLTVDETVLATNATASFAAVFTSAFGADGAGTVTYALGISAPSANSGLIDVATGSAIVLVLNGAVVEGHVATAGGALAFTVSVNAAGDVTLDQIRALSHPDANNPNDSVTLSADTLVTLTATVTDKDGDHQAATANIGQNLAFLDDGPSISASTTQPVLTVDETVLATNATASFASVFTSAFGADGAGTVTYALGISAPSANSGLVDTATGSAIVLVLNGNVVEGHVATAGGALAFTVSVNAAGDVTLDQIRAVVHPNPLTPNESVSLSADNLVTLTATVTDKDGDHQSAVANIGQNLSFLDDAPALGTVQNQQTDNNPATTPAVGTLHFAPGADGAGSAMTITANVTGLLSGGHALVTHQVGNVLTAYQDIGPAGWDAGDTTQVFTITVNPAAGTSGQYVFDLITPLDPTVTETAITGSSSFGAGPTTQGQTLDGAAAQHLAVVSGYHMGGTFNEATWLSTGSAGPTTNYVTAGVNGSTAGWGIDNNNFNGTDEMFVWDFGSQALANPDGAGGFVPPAGVTLPDISTATFELIGYDSGGDGNFATGDDITYVVHYTDGSFDSGHVPEANVDSGTWKFTADAGKFIADIEMFASGLGSGKVDLTSVGVQNSSLDKSIAASVQLTDGDGDSTTVGNFTIHVSTGLVPFAPAAPVVLDLNGDGVHFLGHDAGVTFDYNGDGVREATGWVAPEDGILVRDANHNGTVDGSSEFVFGGGDVSDLQALHAQYGSSLDANDADFASFGVWQDANSNGNVDAGEVTSLTDAGINSISLSSDGIAYSANDDVEVAGTGSFTRADGSTGILADAVFLTRNADEDQRSVSAANTNTALIAALAAAGVAASPAAAHSVDLSSASTVAIAAAIVGSNAPAIADSDDGSRSALGGETKEAVGTDVSQPAHNVSPSSDDQSGGHSLTPTNDTSPATAPADLLEATDAPASAPANDIVSPTVAMPSAEALTGAAAQHGESEGAQASAVVGKVLVDALHGGGAEQSIDALLATLPGHGNAENAAADALASQPVGAVPTWDTGHLAAFTAHANFTMEAVALHHDAVQPVANG